MRQGATIYIKYSSAADAASLRYTEHGRQWGGWRSMGPALTAVNGDSPTPVILKISHVGTPKSTASWTNGRGKSGVWSGFSAPGPYDLGLHANATWTLPPIVVLEEPKRPSFWSTLFGTDSPSAVVTPGPSHSVPEGGGTAGVLAATILALALVRRTFPPTH